MTEASNVAATRVVVVTGASAGIGLATADRLHAAGWTVIGASRRARHRGRGSHW